MLSLGRLLTLTILGGVVYLGFVAGPFGGLGPGDFSPETVAEREVAFWQATRAREEFGAFVNAVRLQREQHRYSWFRALEAGFYTTRAALTFQGLHSRYERVLPDLETAAGVQKAWTKADLDPSAVARAELNWWVTRRLPHLSTLDQVAPLIERDYELRYRLRPGAASDAAARRAEAALLFDASDVDPNLPAITRLLTASYQSLRRTLVRTDAAGD
ncbi:MAG: hypothetical protein IT184_18955 [Acidobacteria bacterium]|nr:hypothetical protein [Acidobacteriota bacterium]